MVRHNQQEKEAVRLQKHGWLPVVSPGLFKIGDIGLMPLTNTKFRKRAL